LIVPLVNLVHHPEQTECRRRLFLSIIASVSRRSLEDLSQGLIASPPDCPFPHQRLPQEEFLHPKDVPEHPN